MIDAISFLIIIVLSIGLSHVFLPYDCRHRLFWIVAPGILLLFITHPMALVFAVGSFALSTFIFLMGCAFDSPRLKTRVPYIILLLLLCLTWRGLPAMHLSSGLEAPFSSSGK